MACNFSAVILAAGFSSRMGQIKALLPVGGRTMIERTVSLYQDADVGDIRVVVGYGKNELLPLLSRLDVTVVDNPDFEAGMFSSVLTGLSTLPSDRDACFIHPVDIPLVKGDTILALRDAYQLAPGKVLRPSFDGRFGHPPLLPSSCFEAILSWKGEAGLKAALSVFEKTTVAKEVGDRHILFDIDTPEDYKKALTELRNDYKKRPDMEVSILFFGALAQQIGQKKVRFVLPSEASFGNLLSEFGRRFGHRLSGYFWDTEANIFKPGVRVVTDGGFIESREAPLRDGEEIRVFPSVGGG